MKTKPVPSAGTPASFVSETHGHRCSVACSGRCLARRLRRNFPAGAEAVHEVMQSPEDETPAARALPDTDG
ncbi:MAG TPA: hypothetical protein VF438_03705 [Candidatus Paceibacterota bacterium]